MQVLTHFIQLCEKTGIFKKEKKKMEKGKIDIETLNGYVILCNFMQFKMAIHNIWQFHIGNEYDVCSPAIFCLV